MCGRHLVFCSHSWLQYFSNYCTINWRQGPQTLYISATKKLKYWRYSSARIEIKRKAWSHQLHHFGNSWTILTRKTNWLSYNSKLPSQTIKRETTMRHTQELISKTSTNLSQKVQNNRFCGERGGGMLSSVAIKRDTKLASSLLCPISCFQTSADKKPPTGRQTRQDCRANVPNIEDFMQRPKRKSSSAWKPEVCLCLNTVITTKRKLWLYF